MVVVFTLMMTAAGVVCVCMGGGGEQKQGVWSLFPLHPQAFHFTIIICMCALGKERNNLIHCDLTNNKSFLQLKVFKKNPSQKSNAPFTCMPSLHLAAA